MKKATKKQLHVDIGWDVIPGVFGLMSQCGSTVTVLATSHKQTLPYYILTCLDAAAYVISESCLQVQ